MKLYPNNNIVAVQFVEFPIENSFLYKVILSDENANLFECYSDQKTFKKLKELGKDISFPSLDSDFYFNIYFYKGELRIKLLS